MPTGDEEYEVRTSIDAITDLTLETMQMVEHWDREDERNRSVQEALALGPAFVLGLMPGEYSLAEHRTYISAALVGYLARLVERLRLPVAATFDQAWSETTFKWVQHFGTPMYDAVAKTAAEYVLQEPLDPPEGDPHASSSLIPGLGPGERSVLRENTLKLVYSEPDPGSGRISVPTGDVLEVNVEDIHRIWKYGFFVRVIEEFVAWQQS